MKDGYSFHSILPFMIMSGSLELLELLPTAFLDGMTNTSLMSEGNSIKPPTFLGSTELQAINARNWKRVLREPGLIGA